MKEISILGIRGIPASHGGFETFAEYLSLYLVQRGWIVNVYCQESGSGDTHYSEWHGINLIHVPVSGQGAISTIIFDLKSIIHACKHNKSIHLTLGYNSGCLNILQRLFSIRNLINMDGLEWRRDKWGVVARSWLWLNERLACWFGNHLIADHPDIKEHLKTRVSESKITMIPYGAPDASTVSDGYLQQFGLLPDEYGIVIARPEPENSIYEIVKSFSEKKRPYKLVILGNYKELENSYHAKVKAAANNNVLFLGAIYDHNVVQSLRCHSRFYIHGHQVGGTNPSLVESLGAGNAVLAHDNKYNKWVAKKGALYFSGLNDLSDCYDKLFSDDEFISNLRVESFNNFKENFGWDNILQQYENLLLSND